MVAVIAIMNELLHVAVCAAAEDDEQQEEPWDDEAEDDGDEQASLGAVRHVPFDVGVIPCSTVATTHFYRVIWKSE